MPSEPVENPRRSADSRWSLGIRHFSALSVETTQIYLHADLRLKEKAMEKTHPVGVKPGRFKPDDTLLGFLKSL